mgnify:CR=1 FL=1
MTDSKAIVAVDDTPEKSPGASNLAPPWQPGQSGNPAGRPKGARSKLSEDFFKALQADFETHGADAIVKMRDEKPNEYAKMVASLMAKELSGEDGAALFPTEIGWRRVRVAD